MRQLSRPARFCPSPLTTRAATQTRRPRSRGEGTHGCLTQGAEAGGARWSPSSSAARLCSCARRVGEASGLDCGGAPHRSRPHRCLALGRRDRRGGLPLKPYLPALQASMPSATLQPPLLQLMIPAEAAHDTVAALGEVGLLQFKDLNADRTAFQRMYANQIKRCDEMARQLRFFTSEVEKAGILVAPRLSSEQVRCTGVDDTVAVLVLHTPPAEGGWCNAAHTVAAKVPSSQCRKEAYRYYTLCLLLNIAPHTHGTSQGALEFDALEARLAQLEVELLELNGNSDRLHRSYNELLELQVGAELMWALVACVKAGAVAFHGWPVVVSGQQCPGVISLPGLCTASLTLAHSALPVCSWCWSGRGFSSRMLGLAPTVRSARAPPPPTLTVSPAAAALGFVADWLGCPQALLTCPPGCSACVRGCKREGWCCVPACPQAFLSQPPRRPAPTLLYYAAIDPQAPVCPT